MVVSERVYCSDWNVKYGRTEWNKALRLLRDKGFPIRSEG